MKDAECVETNGKSYFRFLFLYCFPLGASEVDQIHKFRSYTVLSDLTGQC